MLNHILRISDGVGGFLVLYAVQVTANSAPLEMLSSMTRTPVRHKHGYEARYSAVDDLSDISSISSSHECRN